MITLIVRRDSEPRVIQMTQESVMRELSSINGAEMLLEDTWLEGLKKVRTMFVCLLEADCVLSANYLGSNYGLMRKMLSPMQEGGNAKTAMMASCVGAKRFDKRIYHYELKLHTDVISLDNAVTSWQVKPVTKKNHTKPYEAQIGFVPGAILRYNSIKDTIDSINWDQNDLVKLSTDLSFHLWDTNRRIRVNPNTTYVSSQEYLEEPPRYTIRVPAKAANLFATGGV